MSGYVWVWVVFDLVGGGGVGFYEFFLCVGGNVLVCVNSNGYIKYWVDIVNWSSGWLNWVMVYELVYIY